MSEHQIPTPSTPTDPVTVLSNSPTKRMMPFLGGLPKVENVDLGVFLSYGEFTPGNQDPRPLYDRMLDLAKTADGAGFKYAWVPEHHLIYLIQSPSSLLPLVQLAQHVKMRVGAAALVLPYRNPIQAAGEIAQADNATGGRLDIGVARGAYEFEFDRLGIPFSESLPRFIETLDSMRLLLESEENEVSFHGKHVNFDDVYVWPRPLQKPTPPLWIGAQTEPSIEDAARRGYNVLTSMFFWDDETVERLAAAFQRGKATNGNHDLRFGITRYAHLAADEADAEARLDELMSHWTIQQQLHDFSHVDHPLGVIPPRELSNEVDREEARKNVLVGMEDHVRSKLQHYQDMGIDMVNLSVNYGPPHESVKASIERIGQLGW